MSNIIPIKQLYKTKSKHLTEMLLIEEMVLIDRATDNNYKRLKELRVFIIRINNEIKTIEITKTQRRYYLN